MNDDINKLEPLLIALIEERLGDEQLEELRTLLRRSAAARKHYAAYMLVHGALAWRDAPSLTETDATHEQGASDEKFAPSDGSDARVVPRIARTLTRHITASSMWTAAMVMGLLIAVMAITVPPFYRALTSAPEPATPPPVFAAEISGLEKAEWATSEVATHLGAHLVVGRKLQLTKGLARITYRNGASVILEGPAKFIVSGLNDGFLEVGKIVATVPQQAKGYTVTTTAARVIDLGTEFGLVASADGSTEVCVFSGVVETAVRRPDRTWGPGKTLTASQTAKMRANDADILVTNRSEVNFQRSIADAAFEMGSPTQQRQNVDTAAGVTLIFGGVAPRGGQARQFTFYSGAKGRWITPLLFAYDRATNSFSISGIGASIEITGQGLQSAPFVLTAGSAQVDANCHTFGFFMGKVQLNAAGKITTISSSAGGVPFDSEPGPWLFAYREIPRQIALHRSYSLGGGADEILGTGRVYSARLNVGAPDKAAPVNEPTDAATASEADGVNARTLNSP